MHLNPEDASQNANQCTWLPEALLCPCQTSLFCTSHYDSNKSGKKNNNQQNN